ncbi:acylphosphatase [bacterium]|nr:acylphosphatase [bacterium]
MIARHSIVSGRVQGVGFRWFTRETALGLGCAGWVRNLPDGSVEVHCQGTPEAVRALEEWLERGPGPAGVHGVRSIDSPVDPIVQGFTIR